MNRTLLNQLFDRRLDRLLVLTYEYTPSFINELLSNNRYGPSLVVVDHGIHIAKLHRGEVISGEAVFAPFSGTRTFHPKVYLLECEGRLDMLFGSFNMTRAGFCEEDRYETCVHLVVGSREPSRESLLARGLLTFCQTILDQMRGPHTCVEFSEWVARWIEEVEPCRRSPKDVLGDGGSAPVFTDGQGLMSWQAVEELIGNVTECHAIVPYRGNVENLLGDVVFHRLRSGQECHAKIFLLQNRRGELYSLVGSQNATAEAFTSNIEFGFLRRVDLNDRICGLFGAPGHEPTPAKMVDSGEGFAVLWADLDRRVRRMRAELYGSPMRECRLTGRAAGMREETIVDDLFSGRETSEAQPLEREMTDGEHNQLAGIVKADGGELFVAYSGGRCGPVKVPVYVERGARDHSMSLEEYLEYLANGRVPLWAGTSHDGKRAARLTEQPKLESGPIFAPKGQLDEAYHLVREIVQKYHLTQDTAKREAIASCLIEKMNQHGTTPTKYAYAADFLRNWPRR